MKEKKHVSIHMLVHLKLANVIHKQLSSNLPATFQFFLHNLLKMCYLIKLTIKELYFHTIIILEFTQFTK